MAESLPEHPPKDPLPMRDDRIWIDGCFDFTHHGHAGAILQAKQLGTYLCVGVHSDEAILENKGPTVMSLPERMAAVSACKWTDLPVPDAPYVTDPAWLDLYGCKYVVHGDDVTTDSTGEDCYRIVKQQGRFKIVKRTPGISTTDLVGRMLLCTKTHHFRDLGGALLTVSNMDGEDGMGEQAGREITHADAREMLERVEAYASDSRGVKGKGSPVFYTASESSPPTKLVAGVGPTAGQKLIYVDGGFDLFTPGHIEFLRLVVEKEKSLGNNPYILAGIHNDKTINHWKGLNYPIMNLYERGLCVLQCRYINAVVLEAPFIPSKAFLGSLKGLFDDGRAIEAVYHGPTDFMPGEEDTYQDAKEQDIFQQVGDHRWKGVNAGEIVERILQQRSLYEERQRKKGAKATVEDTLVN